MHEHFQLAATGVPCTMGIHPWYIHDAAAQLAELEQYAHLPHVLAVGECGLDKVCDTSFPLQLSVFRQQVRLAARLHKPLIIHCVRAFHELVVALMEEKVSVPVIIHGFNKKGAVAQLLLAQGYYLSFGAAIFNGRLPAAAILSSVPAHKFFLETDDAEYTIEEIYSKAAAIRNTTPEAIILQVQQNFKNVFYI